MPSVSCLSAEGGFSRAGSSGRGLSTVVADDSGFRTVTKKNIKFIRVVLRVCPN